MQVEPEADRLALVLYQQRHGDALPERDGTAFVSALYESGLLTDANVFICPSGTEAVSGAARLDPSSCSYVGRRNSGPHRLSPEAIRLGTSTLPLAADRSIEAHVELRHVLFADGHVEAVPEADWQARFAGAMGE